MDKLKFWLVCDISAKPTMHGLSCQQCMTCQPSTTCHVNYAWLVMSTMHDLCQICMTCHVKYAWLVVSTMHDLSCQLCMTCHVSHAQLVMSTVHDLSCQLCMTCHVNCAWLNCHISLWHDLGGKLVLPLPTEIRLEYDQRKRLHVKFLWLLLFNGEEKATPD